MDLTPSQERSLEAVLTAATARQKVISLAGPAGTGKTTMLQSIADEISSDAVVVTPTNKAAAVLRKKGVPDAATLYSRFFTSYEEAPGKIRFEPNYQVTESGRGLGPDKLDFADVILLDEASMLQTWLVQHLKKMCNTLVMIGDPHQLPPVGDRQNPDGYFCTRRHDAELTEVLRQGADSPILGLATDIRQGRLPPAKVQQFLPRQPFGTWYDGSQKLVAFTNAHRRELNGWARQVLGIKGTLPKAGDKMVCNSTVSDHLFNGTEFVVREFHWKDKSHLAGLSLTTEDGVEMDVMLDMVFFLEDLPAAAVPEDILAAVRTARQASVAKGDETTGISASYSYCITCHKAQGSEWESVCVVDERFVLGKVDPTGVTARRWLYTAVTRARENLLFPDFRWFKSSTFARAA